MKLDIIAYLASKVIVLFFALGVIVGLVYYLINQQKRILLLKEEKAVLETSLTMQQKATEHHKQDLDQVKKSLHEHMQKRIELEQKRAEFTNTLRREKVNKTPIEKLAEAKPKLIENIINESTKDSFRCIEIITGSKKKLYETPQNCPVTTSGK